MKHLCLVIVAALATTTFAAGHVGGLTLQDQTGKQQEEEKSKDEKDKKVSGPLGAKTNPVRCEDPRGEREYLGRLRCSDGKRPAFSRIGSYGLGPYGNIIDGYRVKCDGAAEVTVFMDMYHEGYVEKEPVPGFTIVNNDNRPQARLKR